MGVRQPTIDRVDLSDPPGRRPRVALLLVIAAVHGMVLLLLLGSRVIEERASSTALTLFDPVERRAPPEALRPSPEPTSGGSPGRERERVAAGPDPIADEPVMDVTPVPTMPNVTVAEIGSASLALGRSGAGGSGTGTGSGDGLGRTSVEPGVLAPADWIRRPNPDAYRRHWPRGHAKVRAAVRLRCQVGPGGRPRDCDVTSETPAELGFGRAAMRIAGEGTVRPIVQDGQERTDIPVLIAIFFDTRENAIDAYH